jgi:hypothetical protein
MKIQAPPVQLPPLVQVVPVQVEVRVTLRARNQHTLQCLLQVPLRKVLHKCTSVFSETDAQLLHSLIAVFQPHWGAGSGTVRLLCLLDLSQQRKYVGALYDMLVNCGHIGNIGGKYLHG